MIKQNSCDRNPGVVKTRNSCLISRFLELSRGLLDNFLKRMLRIYKNQFLIVYTFHERNKWKVYDRKKALGEFFELSKEMQESKYQDRFLLRKRAQSNLASCLSRLNGTSDYCPRCNAIPAVFRATVRSRSTWML